jgi:hypothetical protein
VHIDSSLTCLIIPYVKLELLITAIRCTIEVFYKRIMKLLLIITAIICYTIIRGVWFHSLSLNSQGYKAERYLLKHKKEAKRLVILVILLGIVVLYLLL